MTAAYSIAAPPGVATNVCSKCGECKPATTEFFYADGSALRGSCKECVKAIARKRAETRKAANALGATDVALLKKCRCCGLNKPSTTEFWWKRSVSSDGLASACIECSRKASKEPLVKDGFKVCGVCNQERPATLDFFRKGSTGLRSVCKECDAKYRQAHKDKAAQYRTKNAETLKAQRKTWYEQNASRVKERNLKNNHLRAYRVRMQRQSSPIATLEARIRASIRKAFVQRGGRKGSRLPKILGCSLVFFARHMERQFCEGMSWDRLSEIHIDHIIPLATAKTEEDVIRLNHYTNLRPLWAEDNLRKGARIDYII